MNMFSSVPKYREKKRDEQAQYLEYVGEEQRTDLKNLDLGDAGE